MQAARMAASSDMVVPSEQQHPGGRLAPGLRVATHNVCGLKGASSGWAKLHSLFSEWWRQRLDVICLQETKISGDDTAKQHTAEQTLAAIAERGGVAGYKWFWGGGLQLLVGLLSL
jgi:hypothetical protein